MLYKDGVFDQISVIFDGNANYFLREGKVTQGKRMKYFLEFQLIDFSLNHCDLFISNGWWNVKILQ